MYNISFGSFNFDDSYVITDFDPDGLPIRTSQQNLVGKDGGVIWNRLYDFRTITIGGYVIGDTASDYVTAKRALKNAFAIGDGTSKILSVTESNGDIRYIDCKTTSLPLITEEPGEIYTGAFQLVLTADYPYYRGAYGTETLSIASAAGFLVPAVVPTPLGGLQTNTVNISITGDYGSYPSYIFSPSVTNPRITNQSTGKTFQLEMTINNETGPVPVWFDNRGIHVGTNSEYNQYFVGEYFRLQSGNNNMVFTGADASGATVQITYANEYISV